MASRNSSKVRSTLRRWLTHAAIERLAVTVAMELLGARLMACDGVASLVVRMTASVVHAMIALVTQQCVRTYSAARYFVNFAKPSERIERGRNITLL